MLTGTLSRYFALRFLSSVVGAFIGVVILAGMIDFVELMRRGADWPHATPWALAKISMFRVPQLTERIMPFSVLIGAMSCYLTLSRRLELVVARAAGISAWQFIAPAVIAALLFGTVATTVYNPLSASLDERSKRLESEVVGENVSALQQTGTNGFWVRQKSADGAAIINAKSSRDQGASLGNISIYTFDTEGHFQQRIEARSATLQDGYWQLEDVHMYSSSNPLQTADTYRLNTNLTLAQVRESFATPETVPFWQLPSYIEMADRAGLHAAGYRLQYDELLARPFTLGAMVLLAASVSLRFFRFGGVQKLVLSGITAGFLLFVLSKITDDMSKSELLSPIAAAWTPVLVGSLTGFVVLLFREDGQGFPPALQAGMFKIPPRLGTIVVKMVMKMVVAQAADDTRAAAGERKIMLRNRFNAANRTLAAAVVATAMMVAIPTAGHTQSVVVMVNGEPITALDI